MLEWVEVNKAVSGTGSLQFKIKDLDAGPNTFYIITDIEGIEPPPVTVNITQYAARDGGIVNSIKKDNKHFTITGIFNSMHPDNIQNARYHMYSVASPGNIVQVRYKETGQIEPHAYTGVVESLECDYFGEQVGFQISIVCPTSEPDY